ncbi:MAG: YsnF/AvaK domain-containing protein, partial [Chloroflexota bacterium]|nr:YsnF/AvaK domain-containing protein [Chloroflexota bacterium]
VLAAGPLVAALGPLVGGVATGAVLGAGTGALAGALIGLGIPEDEAHIYEDRFNQGRILVTVKSGAGRYGEAEQILSRAGAEDIKMSNSGMSNSGMSSGSMAGGNMSNRTTTTTAQSAQMPAQTAGTTQNMGSETLRVPVVEETLTAQKTQRQAGEVEIGKHVVEQQVNIPVEVSHEEVTVTRHAVDRPVQAGDQTLQDGQVIRVPVSEEAVQVQKQAHVTEEIEINKQRVTEQRNVSDTVRKEVVDVNTQGQLDAHGGQTTHTETHTDTTRGGGHNH